MEPATAACLGVAVVALSGWSAARITALVQSLPDRLLPTAPSRIVATVTLAAVGFISTPRIPASADPVPPIVRLADGTVDSSIGQDAESTRAVLSAQPASDTAPSTHVVVRGDSLWRIAAATLLDRSGRQPTSGDIARFWPHIYEANRTVIGKDPNLILPGQQFTIPTS